MSHLPAKEKRKKEHKQHGKAHELCESPGRTKQLDSPAAGMLIMSVNYLSNPGRELLNYCPSVITSFAKPWPPYSGFPTQRRGAGRRVQVPTRRLDGEISRGRWGEVERISSNVPSCCLMEGNIFSPQFLKNGKKLSFHGAACKHCYEKLSGRKIWCKKKKL